MTQLLPTHTFDGSFHTTRWTRVVLAKSDSEEGRRALSDLCEACYEPVIVFLRCQTRDPDLSRELAHDFFAGILAGDSIGGAEPNKGRFRSYLLGAVKHFLLNREAAANCQRRGGGTESLSLDDIALPGVRDSGTPSPDDAYDRQWAMSLLGHALAALRKDFAGHGNEADFDLLKPRLTGDAGHGDQQTLATSLGVGLNTLKSDISRLRKRFRTFVEAEVAGTLGESGSVQEELAVLGIAKQ